MRSAYKLETTSEHVAPHRGSCSVCGGACAGERSANPLCPSHQGDTERTRRNVGRGEVCASGSHEALLWSFEKQDRRLQTQGHPRRAWDPVKCDLSQLSFPAGLRWPETQASTPPGAAAAAAFPTPARPLALFARSWSKCSMYWSMTYMSFTGTASVSGLKPATFPKRKRSVFRSYGQKYTVKKMYEAFGSS